MIEKKNFFFNNVSIKNIIKKSNNPIYIYNYKKIILNLFYIKKIKFYCFYSIKSNDNIFLLKLIKNTVNKYDIVSINELKKIILINSKKPYIIFSGCGKTIEEIIISINLKIFCLNIESFQELFKIYYFLRKNKKKINIMIRINPNIEAITHYKINTGNKKNKFGIQFYHIKNFLILTKIMNINILGYDFHIGSQIVFLSPIKKLIKLIIIISKFKKFKYIDIGGGLGINYYNSKNIIKLCYFYNFIKNKFNIKFKIIIELGRYIFGNTCILICKINYLKYNVNYKISILNCGMNDIIRPALYNSYHKLESFNIGNKIKNFFGPICESSDKFINNSNIKVKNNSIIFMYSVGSYCKVMNNNYNSKFKTLELLIYNNKIKIIFNFDNFKNIIKKYD